MKMILFPFYIATSAWIFLHPHFDGVNMIPGLALVLLAMLVAARAFPRSITLNLSRSAEWATVGVLLIAALALGGTTRVLATAGAVVVAFRVVLSSWPNARTFTTGPLFVLGLLAIQCPIVALLDRLSARYHEVPPSIAQFGARCLALFYKGVSIDGSAIIVKRPGDIHEIMVTWEALAIEPLVLLSVATLLVMTLLRARARFLAIVACVFVYFAWFRFIGLSVLHVAFNTPQVFHNPYAIVASLLPLGVLVEILLGRQPLGRSALVVEVRKPRRLTERAAVLMALLTGLLGAVAATFHDPGAKQTQRILIDEYHSNWEWTTMPLDRENYGALTMYNYRSLLDYLGAYYTVAQQTDSLIETSVAGYDVVMIKIPTIPYSEAEKAVLRQFVFNGGGLVVIGDHTNVFGSSAYLNELLAPYQVAFRADATYEFRKGQNSYFSPPRSAHPIVRHANEFQFASSCTITAPLRAQDVIRGYGLKAAYADYSAPSFFPSSEYVLGNPHSFGVFLQGAALPIGKGRLSMFTDSTIFSNYYMFLEGHAELLLGYVDWTGRSNRFSWVNQVALILAISLGLLEVALAARASMQAVGLWAFVCGAACGTALTAWCDSVAYSAPAAVRPYRSVAFDLSHCPTMATSLREFPIYSSQISENGYNTFFVWMQRAGLVPRVSRSLKDGLRDSELVVFVAPSVRFTKAELRQIDDYLNAGGNVWIVDNWRNGWSSTPQIIARYEMALGSALGHDSTSWLGADGKDWGKIAHYIEIRGGQPRVLAQRGHPVVSTRSVGSGTLAVIGAGSAFSDVALGYYKSLPTAEQKKRADLLYALLDDLVLVDRAGQSSQTLRPRR